MCCVINRRSFILCCVINMTSCEDVALVEIGQPRFGSQQYRQSHIWLGRRERERGSSVLAVWGCLWWWKWASPLLRHSVEGRVRVQEGLFSRPNTLLFPLKIPNTEDAQFFNLNPKSAICERAWRNWKKTTEKEQLTGKNRFWGRTEGAVNFDV